VSCRACDALADALQQVHDDAKLDAEIAAPPRAHPA
jgi:hypothetical protein